MISKQITGHNREQCVTREKKEYAKNSRGIYLLLSFRALSLFRAFILCYSFYSVAMTIFHAIVFSIEFQKKETLSLIHFIVWNSYLMKRLYLKKTKNEWFTMWKQKCINLTLDWNWNSSRNHGNNVCTLWSLVQLIVSAQIALRYQMNAKSIVCSVFFYSLHFGM